ncbi:MAG TPA: DUF2628 domain-containing protein [Hyphomicrobiaceae bacterium]|nr:DUF2628 domain-containing protein [Hyphomicrobiaceae bacterium]
MQTYTVHEPPNPPPDRVDRAERLVFIKEGFSWGALLFGPLWLLVHRLWWPLLAYIVADAAIEGARMAAIVDPRWPALGLVALNLMIAFEGDTLRRWALERRGWRMLGTSNGRNRSECERRFFSAWIPAQPIIAARPGSTPGGSGGRDWPVIGGLIGTSN